MSFFYQDDAKITLFYYFWHINARILPTGDIHNDLIYLKSEHYELIAYF